MRSLIFLAFIMTTSLFSFEDQSVNVITGAYQEIETDYTQKAERPLTLKRFYTSDPQGTQGWSFNYPRIIDPKGEKPSSHPSTYETIEYKYNGNERLIEITRKASGTELGKIKLTYGKNSTTGQATTSDGTHIVYAHEKGKKDQILLKEIIVNGVTTVRYEYTHNGNKNTFLTKRTCANGDYLLIDYDYNTGKVKSLTSPKGQTTFTYKGNTTEVREANGTLHIHEINGQKHLSSTTTFDSSGTLLKKVNYQWKEINGTPYLISKETRDGRGKLLVTEIKNYNALASITEDTVKGDLKGLGMEESYTKKYTYDSLNLLKETDDGYVKTKFNYDSHLNVEAQYTIDKNAIKERVFFTYDSFGFLTAIISDDGSKEGRESLEAVTERWVKRFYRTKEGYLQEIKTFAVDLTTGEEILFKKSETPKEGTSSQDEEEDTKTYTYDCLGRITTITNLRGDVTTISYTSLGKPKTVTYADGTFETFTYETNGLVKTHENLLGHITTTIHDYKGRPVSEEKKALNEVFSLKTYKYNAFHLIEDEKGSYTYTLFGDLKTFLTKEGDLHEIDGDRVKSHFTNGDVIVQTFDKESGETVATSLGMIKKTRAQKPLEIQPAPGKEYIFGKQNRLEKTVEKKHNETLFNYDSWGRLQSVQKPDGTTLEYEYDVSSRISHIKSSDGSIDYDYTYNKEGQPVSIKDLNGTSLREYEKGRLVKETFSNGLEIKWYYDKRGRKEKIELPDGSFIHYTYDPLYLRKISRVSKEGELLYAHTYDQFDDYGRVQKSSSIIEGIDGIVPQKLQFDSKGNVISIEEDETKTFTYNENDELEERPRETFENAVLEYDKRGNLKEANGYLLTYDGFDRLISAKNSDFRIEYSYDFLGRRMERKLFEKDELVKQTRYFYLGHEEIGSANKEGEIEELKVCGLNGPIAVELQGEVFLPVNDYLGSIRKLISFKTKESIDSCQYTPFGERLKKFISPWGFCGKREDPETQLIDFGKRDFNPKTGLWITKDPLHGIDGDNPYLYCRNNPLTRKDLLGLYSFNQFINDTSKFFTKTKDNLQQFRDEYAFENVYQHEIHKFIDFTFGEAFFYLVGFHIDPGTTGTFGKGECNDKVRITFVNGILNDRLYFTATMTEFSRTHGYNNVHFVFRNTEGWTRDIINGLLTKMGMPTEHSRRLAALWREQIKEMGGTEGGGVIVHYSHSLGGADTVCALNMLTEEERKMIRVTTIGSPVAIPNHLAQSAVNYGSCRDMVSIFNLLNHLHPILPHRYNVVFLGSVFGIPLIDHFISMPTYADLLDELGREFLETYTEESN